MLRRRAKASWRREGPRAGTGYGLVTAQRPALVCLAVTQRVSRTHVHTPGLSPPDPSKPAGCPVANQKSLYVFSEFYLRVILWLVAQDLTSIG